MTAPLGVYAWRKEVFGPFTGIGGFTGPLRSWGVDSVMADTNAACLDILRRCWDADPVYSDASDVRILEAIAWTTECTIGGPPAHPGRGRAATRASIAMMADSYRG